MFNGHKPLALAIYGMVKLELDDCQLQDANVAQVVAHYDLLQELQIAIPPMEFAAFKTLEGDVLLMQDAAYSAEANKELYIQRFKVSAL